MRGGTKGENSAQGSHRSAPMSGHKVMLIWKLLSGPMLLLLLPSSRSLRYLTDVNGSIVEPAVVYSLYLGSPFDMRILSCTGPGTTVFVVIYLLRCCQDINRTVF